jgi:osmotically inducible protein OsmC
MTKLEKVLYTAKAHTTGGREGGASRTDDGRLEVKLSSPGTPGAGTNPEQLFAAGWSACFLSAIKLAAARMKVMLPADLAVDAEVDLGHNWRRLLPPSSPQRQPAGFGTRSRPGPGGRAHETCPYTKATRDNISVVTNLVETGSVTVTEYLLTPWDVAG